MDIIELINQKRKNFMNEFKYLNLGKDMMNNLFDNFIFVPNHHHNLGVTKVTFKDINDFLKKTKEVKNNLDYVKKIINKKNKKVKHGDLVTIYYYFKEKNSTNNNDEEEMLTSSSYVVNTTDNNIDLMNLDHIGPKTTLPMVFKGLDNFLPGYNNLLTSDNFEYDSEIRFLGKYYPVNINKIKKYDQFDLKIDGMMSSNLGIKYNKVSYQGFKILILHPISIEYMEKKYIENENSKFDESQKNLFKNYYYTTMFENKKKSLYYMLSTIEEVVKNFDDTDNGNIVQNDNRTKEEVKNDFQKFMMEKDMNNEIKLFTKFTEEFDIVLFPIYPTFEYLEVNELVAPQIGLLKKYNNIRNSLEDSEKKWMINEKIVLEDDDEAVRSFWGLKDSLPI